MGNGLPEHLVTLVLECTECGAQSADGRGWKAYLYEDRFEGASEVWVYCADCARREFEDG